MDPLQAIVHRYLDADLNENALFLTERLQALHPRSATWTHLRALACLRLGRAELACEVSREMGLGGGHLGCAYVFARGCLEVKNWAEGVAALRGVRTDESLSAERDRFVPDLPAVKRLLGKLYRAMGDVKRAGECFAAALEADPFMWDAFTDLCDSGVKIRPEKVFRLRSGARIKKPVLDSVKVRGRAPELRLREPSKLPVQAARQGKPPLVADENAAAEGERVVLLATPKRRLRSGLAEIAEPVKQDAPQRRSTRLANQKALPLPSLRAPPSLREPSKLDSKVDSKVDPEAAAAAAAARRTAGPRLPDPRLTPPVHARALVMAYIESETARPSPVTTMMDLLQKLGAGYYHLTRFQPKPCLEAFSSLPLAQQATPWVLSKTARAQYELMSYREARVTFEALRRLSPSWLEDIEVCSTVLWHLKEDTALAFLAHELSDGFHSVPQTWCTLGNLFSLQRCRGEAIKCFRRACQLVPRLPHSFSLLGYEYMEVDEFSDANSAFQQALAVDARHYSAWVGLGRVQERLGQLDKALEYYLGAEKINPQNAVLLTYIARVLDRTGRREAALGYIRRGIRLEPPAAVVGLLRMQAAGMWMRCGQPTEALRELRLVEAMAADEPRVHFLMGRAHAMEGGRGAALKCFTTALSFAPWSEEIRIAMRELDDKGMA